MTIMMMTILRTAIIIIVIIMDTLFDVGRSRAPGRKPYRVINTRSTTVPDRCVIYYVLMVYTARATKRHVDVCDLFTIVYTVTP